MFNKRNLLLTTAISMSLLPLSIYADTSTATAIKALQEEVKTLKEQLDTTVEAVEKSATGVSKTHIGGYGELHYNNLDDSDDKLDFHRFVLFFGHDFNDRTRFHSEFELEHALSGDGKPGEVELEQAYIEFDMNDQMVSRGGVMLVPVGIINEIHEPPTFYGVERNPVEKNIIPATWWEAGGAISGQIGSSGLSYDVMISGGLEVDPASVSIRSGRQKVAKSIANNLAYTGRLKYTGIPGLELSGTIQIQDDISQQSGDGVEGATLLSAHAIWNNGPFGARLLYAGWDIDGAVAAAAGKDTQDGFYAEGSYRITPKVGVFARFNSWSNAANIDKEQTDFGVNYWPHENVVLKADFQSQNDEAGGKDGFNLGIGYQF